MKKLRNVVNNDKIVFRHLKRKQLASILFYLNKNLRKGIGTKKSSEIILEIKEIRQESICLGGGNLFHRPFYKSADLFLEIFRKWYKAETEDDRNLVFFELNLQMERMTSRNEEKVKKIKDLNPQEWQWMVDCYQQNKIEEEDVIESTVRIITKTGISSKYIGKFKF